MSSCSFQPFKSISTYPNKSESNSHLQAELVTAYLNLKYTNEQFKFLFNKKFIDEVLDVLYDEVTTREQKQKKESIDFSDQRFYPYSVDLHRLDEMDELREDSFPEIYEQYSYLELLRIGGFKLDHENFLSELDEVFRNFDG
ncbi:hypothetical protein HDU92_001904 [Lobulomyces angularis]|nr:hypothetical protein HDU92_001904 [Lobulomyces angularis]